MIRGICGDDVYIFTPGRSIVRGNFDSWRNILCSYEQYLPELERTAGA